MSSPEFIHCDCLPTPNSEGKPPGDDDSQTCADVDDLIGLTRELLRDLAGLVCAGKPGDGREVGHGEAINTREHAQSQGDALKAFVESYESYESDLWLSAVSSWETRPPPREPSQGYLGLFCYQLAEFGHLGHHTVDSSRARTPETRLPAESQPQTVRRSPRSRKAPPKRFIEEMPDGRRQKRLRRSSSSLSLSPSLSVDLYELESVVDHRGGYNLEHNGVSIEVPFELRMRWRGHGEEDDTWEGPSNRGVWRLPMVRQYLGQH